MLILTLTNSIGYSGRLPRDEAAFSILLLPADKLVSDIASEIWKIYLILRIFTAASIT